MVVYFILNQKHIPLIFSILLIITHKRGKAKMSGLVSIKMDDKRAPQTWSRGTLTARWQAAEYIIHDKKTKIKAEQTTVHLTVILRRFLCFR